MSSREWAMRCLTEGALRAADEVAARWVRAVRYQSLPPRRTTARPGLIDCHWCTLLLFADFPQHEICPRNVIQAHHHFTPQAPQQPGITRPRFHRERLQRSFQIRTGASREWTTRAGQHCPLRDRPRPCTNPNRIHVLQSSSSTQRGRALVRRRNPDHFPRLSETVRFSTGSTRFVTGRGHDPKTTRICSAFSVCKHFSRLLMRFLGVFSLAQISRRTPKFHEQRPDETDR